MLFVPGYCLTAALLPRADDLDGVERLALSLGLSVAWMSVLALILDWLPVGLYLWPIVVGELASIGAFAAVASRRRSRLPAGDAFVPDLAWQPRRWWQSQPSTVKRIAILIAAAVSLTLAAVAWTFFVPTASDFATEFYMLGDEGLAESFPREATLGRELSVTLGVTNRERGARKYRVEAWAVDPSAPARRALVAKDGPFELSMGGRREWQAAWTYALARRRPAGRVPPVSTRRRPSLTGAWGCG